jgi:hypothetical protein
MKLAKNNYSLFPPKLTNVWATFVQDYVKIHEQKHQNYNDGCPWSTAPKTIDEFIDVCNQRAKWEKENNASIPPFWNCILSHSLFEEIAREIKDIRDARQNT